MLVALVLALGLVQLRDAGGQVRLLTPAPSVEDFPKLALSEVDQYGADAEQVQTKIEVQLDDLAAAALPQHRPAVLAAQALRARSG